MGDQQVWAGRVTFALTAAAAGVQALQQALKDAPDVVATPLVPDMTTGAWNYLPLALISIAALIWISERAFRLGAAIEGRRVNGMVGSVLKAVSGSSALPSPPSKQPASQDGRTYIEDGLRYADLAGRLAGKTDLQKQVLSQPYIGKWMRSRGIFRNVTTVRRDNWLAFIEIDGESTAFMFDNEWLDRLNALTVGDEVLIDGMISSFHRGARFEQCEIIEVISAKSDRAPT